MKVKTGMIKVKVDIGVEKVKEGFFVKKMKMESGMKNFKWQLVWKMKFDNCEKWKWVWKVKMIISGKCKSQWWPVSTVQAGIATPEIWARFDAIFVPDFGQPSLRAENIKVFKMSPKSEVFKNPT